MNSNHTEQDLATAYRSALRLSSTVTHKTKSTLPTRVHKRPRPRRRGRHSIIGREEEEEEENKQRDIHISRPIESWAQNPRLPKSNRTRQFIPKRQRRETKTNDAASRLKAGIYRVEYNGAVWHGTTWSVSLAQQEVLEQFHKGSFPHIGMQKAFSSHSMNPQDRQTGRVKVSIVENFSVFKDHPTNKSARYTKNQQESREMSVFTIERKLTARAQTIHRTYVKEKVRHVLKTWRRKRLLPAFTIWNEWIKGLEREEMQAAAVEVQRVVRAHLCRNGIVRQTNDKAQTRIACVVRQRQALKRVDRLRDRRVLERAATRIQSIYRRNRAKKRLVQALELQKKEDAIISIQRAWRTFRECRLARQILRGKKRLEARRMLIGFLRICAAKNKLYTLKLERAAIRVQTRWRCHHGKLHVQLLRAHKRAENEAATALQARMRSRRARKEVAALRRARMEHCAVKIQARWRARKGQLAVHIIRMEKTRAAKVIQKFYRDNMILFYVLHQRRIRVAKAIQRKFKILKKRKVRAARKIQKSWAQYRLWKKQSLAATQMQCSWRRFIQRETYLHQRTAAIVIQRAFRAHTARATLSALRARRDMLKGMPLCDECHDAVCQVVCSACEGKFCDSCAGMIHSILKDHERMDAESGGKVILHVEWTRMHVEAGSKIQNAWRRRNARILLLAKRAKRIKREHALFMARTRWRYNAKRSANAKVIQAAARGFLGRKHYRKQYESAVLIQAVMRRRLCELQFRKERCCVILLQAQMRGLQERLRFAQKRNACTRMQAFARMHLERNDFLRKRQSAIKIQSMFRSARQRAVYTTTRHAIIRIQSAVRGYQVRQSLRRLHSKAVVIESHSRRYLSRRDFLQTKESVLRIQRSVRLRQAKAELERRKIGYVQLLFVEEKSREYSARKIQRMFRRFRSRKHAALRIQRQWRRKKGEFTAFLVQIARQTASEDDADLDCVWSRHWDPSHEAYYYLHSTTFEHTYDKPAAYVLAEQERACRREMALEESRMFQVIEYEAELSELERKNAPENWQVLFDSASGYKYYVNELLGVSTYERPMVLGRDPDVPLWQMHLHPVSQRPYYCNSDTGETTWDRPVEELGYEFIEYWDFDHSCPYWVSSITGEYVYEKPRELLTAEEKAFDKNMQHGADQGGEERYDDKYLRWFEAMDEETGKPYYYEYNEYTHTTEQIVWEKPQALMEEWEKWDEYWSPEAQRSYFVNKFDASNVTWQKPW